MGKKSLYLVVTFICTNLIGVRSIYAVPTNPFSCTKTNAGNITIIGDMHFTRTFLPSALERIAKVNEFSPTASQDFIQRENCFEHWLFQTFLPSKRNLQIYIEGAEGTRATMLGRIYSNLLQSKQIMDLDALRNMILSQLQMASLSGNASLSGHIEQGLVESFHMIEIPILAALLRNPSSEHLILVGEGHAQKLKSLLPQLGYTINDAKVPVPNDCFLIMDQQACSLQSVASGLHAVRALTTKKMFILGLQARSIFKQLFIPAIFLLSITHTEPALRALAGGAMGLLLMSKLLKTSLITSCYMIGGPSKKMILNHLDQLVNDINYLCNYAPQINKMLDLATVQEILSEWKLICSKQLS